MVGGLQCSLSCTVGAALQWLGVETSSGGSAQSEQHGGEPAGKNPLPVQYDLARFCVCVCVFVCNR